ncbi:AAA family ATPase [Kitasatospora sp. NPDC059408]|uniref:AAA family ATPase n=1 Tax=Kitasatospora sp. NPDC059408 TaxID=3346823 RepID=UPI0036BFF7E2
MTTTTLATARSRALEPVQPGDLVVLIGAAASGKTTLLQDVPAHQIVSLDQLRAAVSEPGDQRATADALLLQHQILTARLRRGVTTYIDAVSGLPHHRLQLVDLARQHGRRPVAVLLRVPLDLCLARNARRPDHERVPEKVLCEQHAQTSAAAAALLGEGFAEIRYHRTGH